MCASCRVAALTGLKTPQQHGPWQRWHFLPYCAPRSAAVWPRLPPSAGVLAQHAAHAACWLHPAEHVGDSQAAYNAEDACSSRGLLALAEDATQYEQQHLNELQQRQLNSLCRLLAEWHCTIKLWHRTSLSVQQSIWPRLDVLAASLRILPAPNTCTQHSGQPVLTIISFVSYTSAHARAGPATSGAHLSNAQILHAPAPHAPDCTLVQ